MTQFRRLCMFCQQPGVSGEHVFANWLKAFVPRDAEKTVHRLLTYGPDGMQVTAGKLNRPGDPASQRLKAPCEACNNGWMSALHPPVKPILGPIAQGRWQALRRPDQRALARWATMTAMVIDQARPDPVFTANQRRRFMDIQEPLQETRIWMCMAKSKISAGQAHRAYISARNPDQRAAVINFWVGSACFHLVVSYIDEVGVEPRFKETTEGLHQIWPGQKAAIRTPPVVLDDWGYPKRVGLFRNDYFDDDQYLRPQNWAPFTADGFSPYGAPLPAPRAKPGSRRGS